MSYYMIYVWLNTKKKAKINELKDSGECVSVKFQLALEISSRSKR